MPPLRPRNFSTRIAGVDGVHPTKNVAARIQARASHKKTSRPQNAEPTKKAAAAAKKRTQKASKLQFAVPTIPQVNGQSTAPETIPVVFPRVLPRPGYKAPTPEAIRAIGLDTMLDADPILIRDMVDDLAPGFMNGLHNFTTPGFDKTKLTQSVLLNYATDIEISRTMPPTHMLAVRSRTNAMNPAGATPNYTLYPTHSMVLGANCAALPPFPAVPPRDESLPKNQINVPVWPIILPSTATYPQLSHFLYTKNSTYLLNSFLPKTTIPTRIAQDPTLLAPFAAELAETFTVQLLMKHMMYVYGLWQNTVALGIFVESLWEAIELMWKILLTAVAIAKGHAHEMLEDEQLQQLQDRQAGNAAAGPSTLV